MRIGRDILDHNTVQYVTPVISSNNNFHLHPTYRNDTTKATGEGRGPGSCACRAYIGAPSESRVKNPVAEPPKLRIG